MPRTVKYLLSSTAIVGAVFLLSMTVADEFGLLARILTSLVVGGLCFAYFQFLVWLEKRRPPEPPYEGEDDA